MDEQTDEFRLKMSAMRLHCNITKARQVCHSSQAEEQQITAKTSTNTSHKTTSILEKGKRKHEKCLQATKDENMDML